MKLRTIFFSAIALSLVFSLGSCEYHKLKKSRDPELKTTAAHEFYEAGKYAKAVPLYEDVILIKRNTQGYEEILYRFADSYYQMRDYILAGHYFRRFTEAFPRSELAEEAQFMSAYCYYLDAPKTSLDQHATYTAINEFGIFLSKYPGSDKVDQCNELIDELRAKLEKKAFDNAKLYYDLGYFRAAVKALENTLEQFPDTKYEEETLFIMLKSAFLYAENSIMSRQKERFEEAKKHYESLVSKYPNSEYKREADRMSENINAMLDNLKTL